MEYLNRHSPRIHFLFNQLQQKIEEYREISDSPILEEIEKRIDELHHHFTDVDMGIDLLEKS